jgi:uncharacterized membrane protein
LPWLGVLAAGYGFGAMFLLEPRTRQRQLFGLGIGLCVAFVMLRYGNAYGDKGYGPLNKTGPWSEQSDWQKTLFSFLNCQKYPPSLMYILMTLGPAITALALFEGARGWLARFFIVFGRVPLFYYLLHLPLIHAVAVALDYHRYGWSPLANDFWGAEPVKLPAGYGHDLPLIYAVWVGVVLLLYPLCWWYAGIKQRHKSAWLSYL